MEISTRSDTTNERKKSKHTQTIIYKIKFQMVTRACPISTMRSHQKIFARAREQMKPTDIQIEQKCKMQKGNQTWKEKYENEQNQFNIFVMQI